MSETITETHGNTGEVASEDDVQRTLKELQRKNTDLERDLGAERARRTALETNLAGEQHARTTAESERDTHATRAATEAELRWTAEKGQATTAITATQQALEAAEEDYARHAELGEWKDAAKAQRAMSEQTAQLLSLRQKDQWLDNNKEKLIAKPPARTEQREHPRRVEPASSHRYAEYIKGDLAGGEETWLNARPQFLNDPNYREDVFSASGVAARKHPRGTASYFREIERILGEEGQQEQVQTEQTQTEENTQRQQPQRQTRQNQSADLPASRRSGPGEDPSGGAKVVKLSADEREMADGLFGDPNRTDSYISDEGKRYEYYHRMKLLKQSRQ